MRRTTGQERVGQVLAGKYRIDAVVGVGAMATVYAATHRTAHRVALKILHADYALRGDVRARFLKEAYNANRVQHPGAVRITDDDVDEVGVPFLVMELLEGETFGARQTRLGVVPTLEVCKLLYEVLDVLVAAHAQGVIHRDLKPDNLFRLRNHHVKVLDFGIARALYDASGARTKTGSLLGTPAFMPPEQARGRVSEIEARTDLWALGATAFTLLSGRLVHEEETPEMSHIAAATKPARPLRAVAPHVPEAVAAIVDRALQFERAHRWASAVEMLAAVEEVVRTAYGESLASSDAPPSTLLAPPRYAPSSESRTGTLVDPFRPMPPTSPTGTVIDPPTNLPALAAPPPARVEPPDGPPADIVLPAGITAAPTAPLVPNAPPAGAGVSTEAARPVSDAPHVGEEPGAPVAPPTEAGHPPSETVALAVPAPADLGAEPRPEAPVPSRPAGPILGAGLREEAHAARPTTWTRTWRVVALFVTLLAVATISAAVARRLTTPASAPSASPT